MASTVKWHEGPIIALDFEATGTNPLEEHFVTAAMVFRTPGRRPATIEWISNPGIPIPDEAAAIHGWTTDRLNTFLGINSAARTVNGHTGYLTRDAALFEIAGKISMAIHQGIPLVVHNAAYDLTLLEAELARHDVDTLTSRGPIGGVVDPMVIEKAFDPYRKVKGGCRGGKVRCGGCRAEDKKLESLCAHYGVKHTGAHDAGADALAAIRLAGRLAQAWPEVARWSFATLHSHQVTWRREQADGLRAYFDKVGTEHDGIDGGWPLHSALVKTATGVSA